MASMAMAAVMATLAVVAPARSIDASPSCFSSTSASCSYSPAAACPSFLTATSSSKRCLASARSSWNGCLVQQSSRSVVSRRRQLVVRAKEGDEVSYVMVKPDGVQRGVVGEIISRFEKKGFKLKGLKLLQTSKELAEEHYAELKERPFFPKLVRYIVSGPVVAMAWEGPGVVASARKLIGVTNPLLAEPGTIRGDLAIEVGRNVVHGSDSPDSGRREVALWFQEDELVEWDPELTPWLRE